MQRVYVGGRLLTFSSYPDFSFRDEWAGLFLLDEKVLNYVAVRTKWGWAAPENAVVESTTDTRNGVTFVHNINGHSVQIQIICDMDERGGITEEWLEIQLEGSEENEVEIGVCGRHAYDNKCVEARIGEGDEKYVIAGNGKIRMIPDGATESQFQDMGNRIQKQGDKEFKIRVIKSPFKERIKIAVERRPLRIAQPANIENTSFYSDSPEWNEAYDRASRTIQILTKRRGWFAGLPWFVQYWGRDTFISLPALTREGYAALAKRTILDFLYRKVDGEIPRLVQENGVPEFGSIDTNPLFLNALADYVSISGDYKLISENKADVFEAFTRTLDGLDRLPVSGGKDTWMDTLEIRKYPLEVAAYTIEAARKLVRIGALPNERYRELKELWENEKEKYFMERSANVLLAAMYNVIPARDALEKAKEWKLITEWGVRSWSPLEVEYDPGEYHGGAIWGLTTAAGLYVALKARDWETSNVLLRALLSRSTWTSYLDEVWDARKGTPLGADAQLWTAAVVIRAIDEVIIDRRCIPPNITKIKRIRWERGRMKHAHFTQSPLKHGNSSNVGNKRW